MTGVPVPLIPKPGLKRMSNSEIRTYKRCRRKWWLQYVRELAPRRGELTGARQLGTRVHHALRQYYTVLGDEGRRQALASLQVLRDAEVAANPLIAEVVEKEHALAMIIVQGYFEWLETEGADEDIEILGAETTIESPSPHDDVLLLGRLDVPVRRKSTGEEGFLDHKTVQNFADPIKTLDLDEQFLMYALMRVLAVAGEPQMRFQIYNMLRKVKRTANANPPFYMRYERYISDAELRGFWTRLWGEINDIKQTEERLALGESHRVVAYPNPRRDCSWDCDFRMVCPMMDDDASDPEYVLAINFEYKDPHSYYYDEDPEETEPSDATVI